jgi:gamma-glutamylcyclotransferase (GGCT)/AIG2-like uncharacterized protein YtfP
MAYMFLNGGGMRGGPVHDHIEGVPLVGEARTAPRYRFYSVRDEFPALYPDPDGGAPIAGELYDVPMEMLRDALLPAEPPELELGIIELEDGDSSLAMILRAEVHARGDGLVDITEHGGWRAYRGLGTPKP